MLELCWAGKCYSSDSPIEKKLRQDADAQTRVTGVAWVHGNHSWMLGCTQTQGGIDWQRNPSQKKKKEKMKRKKKRRSEKMKAKTFISFCHNIFSLWLLLHSVGSGVRIIFVLSGENVLGCSQNSAPSTRLCFSIARCNPGLAHCLHQAHKCVIHTNLFL